MFIRLRTQKKGQSTLEYAVLIGVVATALLLMKEYVKRGYQGNLRKQGDTLGQQFEKGTVVKDTQNNFTASVEKVTQSKEQAASRSHTTQAGTETGVALP